MRVYLASNWESQARLVALVSRVDGGSHEVVSSWLWEEPGQGFRVLSEMQCVEKAHRDLGEILTADLVIVDTLEETQSGGREVELGFAVGKHPVWLVGPCRNIFHQVTTRQFVDWDSCLDALGSWRGVP